VPSAFSRSLIPFFLSLILLSAGALKGYELFTASPPETSLWTSRGFLIAVIEVEFALGLWLLFGLWPPGARRAALAAFLAFFVVSLFKALAGEASCSCFGRVPVSPRYTAALDFAAIFSLWLWRPPARAERPVGSRWLRVAAVLLLFLLVGVPSGIVLAAHRPASLNPDAEIDANQSVVLLEPEKWLGRRCPLLKYIDVGGELSHGGWLVVLYHHDCPRCQEVAPEYEARATAAAADPAAPRTAFIAVPPHGAPLWQFVPDSPCRQGRLNESKNWFVATPVVMRLQDGVVQSETAD
jgi:hypothetical protein